LTLGHGRKGGRKDEYCHTSLNGTKQDTVKEKEIKKGERFSPKTTYIGVRKIATGNRPHRRAGKNDPGKIRNREPGF